MVAKKDADVDGDQVLGILHDLILYFQSYVDDQLISTNMIKNAVIAGHDGNIWASSSGFNVSASFLPQMPLMSKSAKY